MQEFYYKRQSEAHWTRTEAAIRDDALMRADYMLKGAKEPILVGKRVAGTIRIVQKKEPGKGWKAYPEIQTKPRRKFTR